jgi:hypothetical protein
MMVQTTEAASFTLAPYLTPLDATYNKVAYRPSPPALGIPSWIDRANMGFARLQKFGDRKFSEAGRGL